MIQSTQLPLDETGVVTEPLHTTMQPVYMSLWHVNTQAAHNSLHFMSSASNTEGLPKSLDSHVVSHRDLFCWLSKYLRDFSSWTFLFTWIKALLSMWFFSPSGFLPPLSFNFYYNFFQQKIFQSSWLRAVTSKKNHEKVKLSQLPRRLNRSKRNQREKIHRLLLHRL